MTVTDEWDAVVVVDEFDAETVDETWTAEIVAPDEFTATIVEEVWTLDGDPEATLTAEVVVDQFILEGPPQTAEFRTTTVVAPPATRGVNGIYTAGAALGGQRAVVLTAARTAVYADATDAATLGRVVGITTGAAALGAEVTVQPIGLMVDPSWNWTPGRPIFLGVDGALTQTRPTASTAAYLHRLGHAVDTHSMFIDIVAPIALI